MEREATPNRKVCRNQRSWAWLSVIPLRLKESKCKQQNFNVGSREQSSSTLVLCIIPRSNLWGSHLGLLIYIDPRNCLRTLRKDIYPFPKQGLSDHSLWVWKPGLCVFEHMLLMWLHFWNWIENHQPRRVAQLFCWLEDRLLSICSSWLGRIPGK